MKDPIRYVRKATIAALNGNIDLNGTNVPVYGRVPKSASYPFIRVYSVETNEVDQNIDTFNTEVITRLEVNTRFDSNDGGELDCNIITDEIVKLIRTRSNGYIDLTSDNFRVYTATVASLSYIEDELNDKTYFRSVIEISNKVQEI